MAVPLQDLPELEAGQALPPAFEEHVALMFELMAVAYETDLTRVFSFIVAIGGSRVTAASNASSSALW